MSWNNSIGNAGCRGRRECRREPPWDKETQPTQPPRPWWGWGGAETQEIHQAQTMNLYKLLKMGGHQKTNPCNLGHSWLFWTWLGPQLCLRQMMRKGTSPDQEVWGQEVSEGHHTAPPRALQAHLWQGVPAVLHGKEHPEVLVAFSQINVAIDPSI